jgi:transcriptional regulator with XRE-family HTH domain
MGYHDLRQLCSTQFGSLSVSERTQEEQELLVLGLAIGQVRERRGLSVGELSAVTGVVQTRIQALEAGQLDPDYDLLLTLAEGIGVRLSAFMVRVEELETEGQALGK